jgi:hypothetical protein
MHCLADCLMCTYWGDRVDHNSLCICDGVAARDLNTSGVCVRASSCRCSRDSDDDHASCRPAVSKVASDLVVRGC